MTDCIYCNEEYTKDHDCDLRHLDQMEAAGGFLRRKDASISSPSKLYSVTDLATVIQSQAHLIESLADQLRELHNNSGLDDQNIYDLLKEAR